MDERTPLRILSAVVAAALLGACGDDAFKPANGTFKSAGGFVCELPGSSWLRALQYPELYLELRHPDEENEVQTRLSIYEDQSRSREEIEGYRVSELNSRKGDPAFKAEPLREIAVDGRKGILTDRTYMDGGAARHRKTPLPPFVPTRTQTIYVSGPARSYVIEFSAPASLFEKHRISFEKLVASIKFTP